MIQYGNANSAMKHSSKEVKSRSMKQNVPLIRKINSALLVIILSKGQNIVQRILRYSTCTLPESPVQFGHRSFQSRYNLKS